MTDSKPNPAVSALLDFETPLRLAKGQAAALSGALAEGAFDHDTLAAAADALFRDLDQIEKHWRESVNSLGGRA